MPSWAMGPGVRGSLLFGLSLVGEVQLDIRICEVLFTALMNSKVHAMGYVGARAGLRSDAW